MSTIEDVRSELSRLLIKANALKFGVFKLTSGRLSPYYIDLRLVPSFPDVFHRVIDLYKRLIKEKVMEYDRIAGVPTAGIPFASVIAYDLHKPFLYIRKEAKTHGRERLVEGYLAPGDKVLIVDDLATTGKSSAEAVEAVRKEGGVVTDLVVLVDRLEGASSRMDEANIRLHSVITIKDLADHLYDSGVITRDQLDEILRQTRS